MTSVQPSVRAALLALALSASLLLLPAAPSHAGGAPADPAFFVDCPDEPTHAYFDMSAGTAATMGPASVTCEQAAPNGSVRHMGFVSTAFSWPGATVLHAQALTTGAAVSMKSESPIPAGTATMKIRYALQTQDALGATVTAEDTFTLVMHAVTAAPACTNTSVATPAGTPIDVADRCAGDGVTTVVDQQPRHGKLSQPSSTGAVTYTPDPGYAGPDAFRVRASNVVGAATSTVDVDVQAPRAVVAPPAPASEAPAQGALVAAAATGGPWRLERGGAVRVLRGRRGGVRVLTGYRAVCPSGVRLCTGRITLKVLVRSPRTNRRYRVFLTGKVRHRTIPGGASQRVSFRLNGRARRLLRKLGAFDAVLRGSVRSDGGAAIVRQTGLRVE